MTGLPFFTGSDAPEIEPIDWYLPNILARGVGTFWSGQPGVSKSIHAIILAAVLCLGKPFAGIANSKRYRVLYLDFDASWNWIGPYVKACFRGAGLEGIPDNFYYWSPLTKQCIIEGVISSALEYIGEYITTTVKEQKIDIVIVDSLSMGVAGDSNKGQDITIALQLGLSGARAEGAAVLVLDHLPKAARGSEGLGLVPMAKGAQEKRAWGRVMISLEQEGEVGSERVTRWSVEKSNSEHFAPFLTKLIFNKDSSGQLDSIKLEAIGEAGARTSPTTSPRDEAMQNIIKILHEDGGEVQRKAFGYDGTVERTLKILTQSGVIEKSGYGKYRLKVTSPLRQPLESDKVAKFEKEDDLATSPSTSPTSPDVAKWKYEGEI